MNEKLRAIKEELDLLLEENQLPDLPEGIDIEDLQGLIETIATEEYAKASNPETIEQVNALVEAIAIRVGLICMFVEQSEADTTVTVSGKDLTNLFAALLSRGLTTVKVIATE